MLPPPENCQMSPNLCKSGRIIFFLEKFLKSQTPPIWGGFPVSAPALWMQLLWRERTAPAHPRDDPTAHRNLDFLSQTTNSVPKTAPQLPQAPGTGKLPTRQSFAKVFFYFSPLPDSNQHFKFHFHPNPAVLLLNVMQKPEFHKVSAVLLETWAVARKGNSCCTKIFLC